MLDNLVSFKVEAMDQYRVHSDRVLCVWDEREFLSQMCWRSGSCSICGELKLLPEHCNEDSGMGLDWIVSVIQGTSLLPGDVAWRLYNIPL